MKQKKERKLYKIGRLTELLGITSRTVRYYDQFGLLPHVKRSSGNVRLFDDEDIEIIKKVRRMQKEEFLPLDVIRERLFGKAEDKETISSVVVTDSSAAIPNELIKRYRIEVMPLKVHMDGTIYLDNKTITPKEFWEKVPSLQSKPTTSPVTVEEFRQKYLELAEKGFKKIYSLHLSSTLSQTYENAVAASHKVADKVEVVVVDTKSTGAGLGLFVKHIAKAVYNGDSKESIDILIAKQTPLIHYVVSVNNLKYLIEGGIMKGIDPNQQKLVEKILSFKPVFSLKDGEIDIIECCRDKKESINLMINLLSEEVEARGGYVENIMINYNYLYGEALDLINHIKTAYPETDVYLEEGCPALSVYVGPQTISLSVL